MTKNKATGTWAFVQPMIGPLTTNIKDAGKNGMSMIKEKSGNTWRIVNNATNNFGPFRLVKDTTKNTWKLVAPTVKPVGSKLA